MRKLATTITEILMIAYWIAAAALAFGWVSIDPEWMYSDHENPLVIAWNWSFFPIDIAFAALGLFAKFANLHAARRYKLEVSAATLMICAGLMAVSFWLITADFNVAWWAVNIWLILLGSANLYRSQIAQ